MARGENSIAGDGMGLEHATSWTWDTAPSARAVLKPYITLAVGFQYLNA